MRAPSIDRCLHQLVESAAADSPTTAAVWCDGVQRSFAELAEDIERVAVAIASATSGPEARVGVLSWNRLEYLTLIYAIPAAGRIAVLLNARLAPAEIAAQLDEAGVEVLLGEAELIEPLESRLAGVASLGKVVHFGPEYQRWVNAAGPTPTPEAVPTDVCWILFTSGSTGRPKGAMLTHRSVLAGLRSAADARPVLAEDVFLYPYPLFHVSNHNLVMQHEHARTVVLLRQFEAGAVLDACARHGVTTMSLAPTMIAMLLDHPDFDPAAFRSVRTIGYGASAISEALLRRVMTETDVGLSQGYGMTEGSGSVSFLDAAAHRLAASEKPHLLASAGRPVRTVELRLVDDGPDGTLVDVAPGAVGEIVFRGPQVFAGYWGQPETTRSTIVDGWLRTGDLGRLDAEGYLYIVDRKKDMIITGGENVASREVEDVLQAHPAVRQVCVVGVPDAKWGEAVCAVVSLRAQPNGRGEGAAEDALIAHCRSLLAGYKRPRHVVFVADIPVNANGKYDKRAIREMAVEKVAAR